MSRSGDFRGDNGQMDRQTDDFTPAHARRVINMDVYGIGCWNGSALGLGG